MVDRPPWTLLHAELHRTLKQRQLLQPGQGILVAVSGGQDSLCLTQLLLDLQPKWGWKLAIGHCDHRWRLDSAANAAYVRDLADSWQLPFHLVTAPVALTTEATARDWRYRVLTEIAQTENLTAITTGHTATDRSETLLHHLLRGSGMDGLPALAWKRPLQPEISLVRPLLDQTRAETAVFCQARHLTPWEDSTNQDLSYTRNRIRQELFPYLQTHFNPQIEKTLAQTAELLEAEVAFLQAEADRLLQASRHPDQTGLNRVLLRSAPLALQRRVARSFLKEILPLAPEFDHIAKLVALIPAPNRSQTDPFPGGAIAHVDGDWIYLKH